MPTFTFTISEAFPADDAVARFITVVAMMSNDWLRLWHEMDAIDDADPDADARRIWSFRLQAALHFEAAKFLTETQRHVPDVARFIAGLGGSCALRLRPRHRSHGPDVVALSGRLVHASPGPHLPLLDDAP